MLNGFIYLVCFLLGVLTVETLDPTINANVQRLRIDDSDLIVEVHKTHAHPFLAEYDFRIVLKLGSTELDSIELSDTGGRSRIDVFRIDDSTMAFRHYGNTQCLNLAREKFEYCGSDVTGKRIGKFDFDSTKKWKFISVDARENH